MNAQQRAILSRATLNAPMPPDCLRLQVWRKADGGFDACSTMSVEKMNTADGLAYLVKLFSLVRTIEQNMLEHLARKSGTGKASPQELVEEFRKIVNDAERECPRPDSLTMAHEVPNKQPGEKT